MNGLVLLAASRSYTDESLDGMGALKGSNCTIQSIEDIEGGHRVTFLWVDNNEVEHTDHMDVMNGENGDKGDTGIGLPEGGTAGQVLVKKSNTDYDTEWGTPAGGGDMLKSVYDTDNDGKVDSAENADKVDGHTVAKDVPADAKFTDTVYDDTEIRGEIADKVDKVSGKGLSTEDYTSEEKTKLAGVEASAEVNTIESITLNGTEVTPDANKNVALTVITNAVNDLVNYYLKSETYSKTEVDDIVTAIKNSRFEVVATLPTTDIKTNVIYLVPKSSSQTSNVKDEYINLDGTTAGWEKIGDTDIDLSDYVTTQALNTALANYTTTADLTTLLAGKQDTLTFDDAPTKNSNNLVKSGGVYTTNDKIYQVMGQNSAKNFIPFDLDKIKAKNTTGTWNGNVYSLNGIDFTFNSDGSVDASGTATETASVHYYDPAELPPFGGDRILRLTGCPSGGSGTTYKVMAYRANAVDGSTGTAEEYGDGISLKWLNNGSGIKAFVSISVYTGAGTIDITFKPMLRLSTDTDNTFAPYAKTNQELTAENEALTNQTNDIVNVLGAKNLILYPCNHGSCTNNGITFTDNGDGTVTANGTATANASYNISQRFGVSGGSFSLKNGNYLLSGCESGSNTTFFIQAGVTKDNVYSLLNKNFDGDTEITVDGDDNSNDSANIAVQIVVRSGQTLTNKVFKPMIRLASIQDDTWVPYVPTNKELMSCKLNGYVGAKNLNSYPYTNTSYVSNGITWTDNGDGTVTANGTATADSYFGCHQRGVNTNNQLIIPNGTYIASGCPDTGSGTTYEIRIERTYNNAVDNLAFVRTMAGKVFTANGDDSFNDHVRLQINLVIRSGATVSNLTFKPMIRRVEDTDSTWQPYAKTNRELTEKIDIVGNLFTTTTKVVDNITHGIATTVATLENLPIGTYVVSGQFNSDSAMSGGGLVQFASSGVIQNGASCSTIINQGFKANAGLTGIFNVTNATNQINLQIYTANADLTVASARLAAIRIA